MKREQMKNEEWYHIGVHRYDAVAKAKTFSQFECQTIMKFLNTVRDMAS